MSAKALSRGRPYARLRPGAELAENAKIGNFVEIKNAEIAEGAKVNHLSYTWAMPRWVRRANIGAGTITCNYDGVMKHRTEIGARTCSSARTRCWWRPLRWATSAMTATGTVVTKRRGSRCALAVARAEAGTNKPGYARKLFDMLKCEERLARIKGA